MQMEQTVAIFLHNHDIDMVGERQIDLYSRVRQNAVSVLSQLVI